MPLVRPDPEPVEEQPRDIDEQVREKGENFWSILRLAVGKAANVRHIHIPGFVKEGAHSVWQSDMAKQPGWFGKKRRRKH